MHAKFVALDELELAHACGDWDLLGLFSCAAHLTMQCHIYSPRYHRHLLSPYASFWAVVMIAAAQPCLLGIGRTVCLRRSPQLAADVLVKMNNNKSDERALQAACKGVFAPAGYIGELLMSPSHCILSTRPLNCIRRRQICTCLLQELVPRPSRKTTRRSRQTIQGLAESKLGCNGQRLVAPWTRTSKKNTRWADEMQLRSSTSQGQAGSMFCRERSTAVNRAGPCPSCQAKCKYIEVNYVVVC